MNITQHFMADSTTDPLDALADDCAAKMSHMERLGDIGPAVIDHDLSGFFDLRDGKILVLSDPGYIIRKERVRDIYVEETGPHNFRGENITCFLRKTFQDVLRDHERRLAILFRG